MIYGYNSKLSSHGIDTIMDYGRGLMEELKKVRGTEEVGVALRCPDECISTRLIGETPSFENDRSSLLHIVLGALYSPM
jgi:hypothetical protein